ncbi:MAG: Flp pilus assembly complex ATPase component TadA [Phycisphaerales bacterium]|nr:Flp pilus assembly complex ATPase component TadA [Phycisphaerales bacterium]
MPITAIELLAQVPDSTVYVSWWKLVLVFLVFAGWTKFAEWVDKDTVAVNTYRVAWNLGVLALGATTLGLMLFVPIFGAGIAAAAVLCLAVMLGYVLHRNGLVVEHDKVLTAEHIGRLLSGKGGKGEKKLEVHEFVRITGPDKKPVTLPDDNEGRQAFALAQAVLFDALRRMGSDIFVQPAGEASKVRLMIDGVAADRDPIPRAEGDAIVGFFKRAAGLSLEERRKPQVGRLMATIADKKFDLIVRTQGSTAGEQLVVRILGDERTFKIGDLGFTDEQLGRVRDLLHEQHGVLLFTAPPKQGLSTTIHSVTRSKDAFLLNIQTLDYDDEIRIDNVTQHLHVPGGERSFYDDLVRVTRTDPDVIIVPTVKDRGVPPLLAEVAKKPQVITGIHALDLYDGLRRWISMVEDSKLVARGLRAIFHQRLARKLCTTCKAAYKPDAATLQKLSMPADQVLYRPPEAQFDKHGQPMLCEACGGSGYSGRVGVFVLLENDADVQQAIAAGGDELKAVLMKKSGLSLQQQALAKVLDGTTSIDEVIRVTRPVQQPRAAAPSSAKAAS